MSVFGPIDVFTICSYTKKKVDGPFNPRITKLKKSHIRRLMRDLGFRSVFLRLASVDFINTSAGANAKKYYSPNLDFSSEVQIRGIQCIETLLRRGLGYRIIFNMGGKVYNPEDPSTLPDVTFVITDISGNIEFGQLEAHHMLWREQAGQHSHFFGHLSGCGNFEAVFTKDKLTIKRDGKVELEFFHFDKLLSPEQLKIYNKYASVLGEHKIFRTAPANEDALVVAEPFAEYMRSRSDPHEYGSPLPSGVSKLLANRLKTSPLAIDTNFMRTASMECKTKSFTAVIRNNVLIVHPKSGKPPAVEVVLPAHMLNTNLDQSHLRESYGSMMLCCSSNNQYGFVVRPLTADRILVLQSGWPEKTMLVDLKLLYQLKTGVPVETNPRELWAKCSSSSNIMEPTEDSLQYVSAQGIFELEYASSLTANEIILYFKDLSVAGTDNKKISITLWSRLHPEAPQDVNQEEPEDFGDLHLFRSEEVTPAALYHSATSGLVFTALTYGVDDGEEVIDFKLDCCRIGTAAQALELVATGNHKVGYDEFSGQIFYWLEKKGIVFFYAVQSSPEIKLLVICYHKNQFVPLGGNNGVHTVGPNMKWLPIKSGSEIVNVAFKPKTTKAWKCGRARFDMFLFTPDF